MHTLYARFNTGLLVFIALTGIVLVTMLATRAYGGPLDPPASPASTLPQVEPRSPIPPVGWDGTSPITIPSAGSYFLTRNLTAVPITIAAANVTLDLNGFTLFGGGSAAHGITATPGTKRHIVIRNGTITGWDYGVFLDQATRSTFSDLNISAASAAGLLIASGNVVSRVDSSNNGTYGIWVVAGVDYGGSIDESNFSGNATGIYLVGNNVAVRNSVSDVNASHGIYISGSWSDVGESRVVGNGANGIFINGNRNAIVHTHVDGNGVAPPIHDGGAGNIIAPISPATGANPAENIGFP